MPPVFLSIEEPTVIGYIVIGASAILALIFTVTKPIISVTKAITEHASLLKSIKEMFEKHERESKEHVIKNENEHKELWNYNDEQDKTINDHETRLRIIEEKEGE